MNNINIKSGSSIDIKLGYESEISGLFKFGEYGPTLTEAITFIFSQTLQRDMFFGAWAQAYINGDGEYRLKITSPCDDISTYKELIPKYIEAGKKALKTYNLSVLDSAPKTWEFLLPFGLAMVNVKSIQLLHFPPLETFTYKDYLYSPTNRRWECLLNQNDFNSINNTSVERIIDIAPIAAPGGAGKELTNYNSLFVSYAKSQLNNFLRPQEVTKNTFTQPVIAYGAPVRLWLENNYQSQLKSLKTSLPLRTLQIIKLNMLEEDPTIMTWVLCANHPSEYLYDTSISLQDATKKNGKYPAPIDVICQDLIAAGWQAHMSEHPGDDPYKTLHDMEERWGWDPQSNTVKKEKENIDRLLKIMKEQNLEFSLDNNSFKPTKEQANAKTFALQRNSKQCTTDKYSSYAIDIKAKNIFSPIKMDKHACIDKHNELIQAGGYIIDWTPAKSDNDVIEYRVIKYNRYSSSPLAEQITSSGQWKKEKFFSKYRPIYGADFNEIKLIGFPGYVLSIIASPGRRSYQLWNFDPLAEGDCLSSGSFKSGGFSNISVDRELLPIGNYVLDRKGSNYRVWSFDPQSKPPLSLPTIQEGQWDSIDDSDSMIILGDYVLTWKPNDIESGCRVWSFDPKQSNPLGTSPLVISKLPKNFHKSSNLFSVIPNIPVEESEEKTPGTMAFMRKEIKHVIYYMVESRSFDNVLGWLYKNGKKEGINWVGDNKNGFRGLDSSMSNNMPNGKKVSVTKYQNGNLSNDFVLGGPAQDPWHDNSDVLMQMFHSCDGYKEKQTPTMSGFAWNQADEAVLTSFTPNQLPVLNGLAQNFAISDDWFSSIPGGTDVNRGFSVSGSAYNRLGTWEGGDAYQNWPDQEHRQSIWKALRNHGHKDWKIYYNILWMNAVFTHQLYLKGQIPEVDADWDKAVLEVKNTEELPNSQWVSPMKQFYDDIDNNSLPRFSYIEPAWVGDKCTSYHPGSSKDGINSLVPAESALNDIYKKLKSNPEIWEKTLLVVTSDKNGGLFDHVPPKQAEKPWPNDVSDGFEFDLMGPRVPAIFVSPWIKPNTIIRSENKQGFDSTSFAATLLSWYGIEKNTWGLGDRITNVSTIEKVFNEEKIRTKNVPPLFTVPYDKKHPKKC